jgi:hypothetical protein
VVCPARVNQDGLHVANFLKHGQVVAEDVFVLKLELKLLDQTHLDHLGQVAQLLAFVFVGLFSFRILFLLFHPGHNDLKDVALLLLKFPGLQRVVAPEGLGVLLDSEEHLLLRRPVCEHESARLTLTIGIYLGRVLLPTSFYAHTFALHKLA